MRILLHAFLVFCLLSCTEKKNKPLLSAENLDSWFVSVDENTDTILRTPKGALLKIEKGSFSERVELEIKEAYTMQDMLLGGLVTESDGKPLTSGGMIYINAKDGSAVSLLKPIKAALPTDYLDSAMQVYKSETDSINWKPVDTLPDNSMSDQIGYGKQLFMQNCATCHSLDRRLTGPALRNFRNRGNWSNRQEVYKWIRNPVSYMASNEYAKNLKEEYGSVMQAFPDLTRRQIDAVIVFLQNAENNPYDAITWKLNDTSSLENIDLNRICIDTLYYNDSINTLPSEIDNTVFSDINKFADDTTNDGDFEEPANDTSRIPESEAYVFQINTLGWYNIDADLAGKKGTVLGKITVTLIPEDYEGMNVYVLFPAYKQLACSSGDSANRFSFEKVDGRLPVFLGAEGLVIAYGSIGDQFYVGSKNFITGIKQELTLSLKKSTKEEFLDLIKKNKIESVNLDPPPLKMKVENYPCSEYPRDTIKGGSPQIRALNY